MKSFLSLPKRRGAPGRPWGRLLAAALGVATLTGCFWYHRRSDEMPGNLAPGDQPDKILYQKAVGEINKGRYDVGRLTLQTLINTYPDSEYLSKAKLAIADSYYREGGVSGLTQAEAEYKDFITFFPTAPEAPEAEYRAGMSHFRLMGKANRDLTEARDAQTEFEEFLEKYPDNRLMPEVKGRLREVQEVVAEGDFETARLYYQKSAFRAAASRFQEIADKYPNFSQADLALWYLGQSLERLRKQDEAAASYGRIITDYPLSGSLRQAKARLVALHKPIPKPTRAMMARAEADRAVAKHHHRNLIARAGGAMASSPDLSATRHGPVRIGQHPGAGVEEAQAQTPKAGTASIAVQPLSDSASDAAATPGSRSASEGGNAAGTHETSPPPASPPAPNSAASSTNNPPSGSSQPAQASQSTSASKDSKDAGAEGTPPAKKGKFHFLKKLIPI